MGLFDKIKNMFTEEVADDEVKVEQVKKEVTHVSIETPQMKDFSFVDDLLEAEEEKNEIAKPVFFDDNDFNDLNLIENDTPKFVEKEIYSKKIEEQPKEEKKVFKPTPIISPVYGILDKNYHKEDIVSRVEVESSTSENEHTIDSIRNKAYGTLEDELENTLFGNNSILFKQVSDAKPDEKEVQLEKIDDDALTNLTDDISKELDELLQRKEKYLEKPIKGEETVTEDLLDFIDSTLYKDGEDE